MEGYNMQIICNKNHVIQSKSQHFTPLWLFFFLPNLKITSYKFY